MMNRRFLHPASLFFLLTVLTALLSWVGSIYGWQDVQSLISAEGLRWLLRNAVPGFLQAPLLGHLLIVAFGVGLWMHSGLGTLFKRLIAQRGRISRKERRALSLSLIAGGICLLCGLLLACGPWAIVRSITGGLDDSPLSDGFSLLLSLGMGVMAMVYGYAVDYYRTDRDLLQGLSYAFVRFSGYFITLFCIVQFFSALHYTGIDRCLGIGHPAYEYAYMGCVLGALFLVGSKK